MLLVPLGCKEREKCQYSSHLYRSTPPICIAIRLPFVSQCFWENLVVVEGCPIALPSGACTRGLDLTYVVARLQMKRFKISLRDWNFQVGGTSAERSLHERFFRATKFLTKNALKFSPIFFEPLFCGSKKLPQNSRQISCPITLPKMKRKSPTSFCRTAGRNFQARMKSVAPNAGRDKAGGSDFPHFAIPTPPPPRRNAENADFLSPKGPFRGLYKGFCKNQ